MVFCIMSAVFLGTLMIGGSGLIPSQPPDTPCPSVFSYETLPSQNVWIGIISVNVPRNRIPLELFVHLQIQSALPTKYVGLVELIGDRKEVIRQIMSCDGQLVKYRVRFPLINPLPTVHLISLNSEVICTGDSVTGPVVTDIRLQHSLYSVVSNKTNNEDYITPEEKIYELTFKGSVECGQAVFYPNPMMKGGQLSRRGEWPWLSAIYSISSKGLEFLCSGSLISNKFVITAGHCVWSEKAGYLNASSIIIYLGKFNLKNWTEPGSTLVEVDEVNIHPEFNPVQYSADLALLRLAKPVHFNAFIQPVCIWNGSSVLDDIVGHVGTIAGWSRDTSGTRISLEPELIQLPVVSNKECINSRAEFMYLTSSKTFCAGSKNGTGPCNGDSGSGLMLPVSSGNATRWHLRGVVSLSLLNNANNTCDLMQYIVFTDTAKFYYWITHIITK